MLIVVNDNISLFLYVIIKHELFFIHINCYCSMINAVLSSSAGDYYVVSDAITLSTGLPLKGVAHISGLIKGCSISMLHPCQGLSPLLSLHICSMKDGGSLVMK